jgi:ribosomal protein S18 acetylase RimI-like enzyme
MRPDTGGATGEGGTARRDEGLSGAPLCRGHRVVVTDTPDEELRRRVRAEVRRFNDERCEHFARSRSPARRPIALDAYVTDTDGRPIAGLLAMARFWWTGRGGLEVEDLWVAAPFRRRGYGRRLMECVEDEGAKRGCAFAHVRTYSFQARGFYERLGYRVIGQLVDYAPGVTLYLLRKELA